MERATMMQHQGASMPRLSLPSTTSGDAFPAPLVGWFLTVVGISIAGLWAMLLATGQVPEVAEGRTDIWFHITAEALAAVLLLTAGACVLRRGRRARVLAAAALGVLAYTAVNSAGYYAEAADWAMVGMFGLILAATAWALGHVLRSTPPTPGSPP
jgi:hypothetical protein